MKACYSLILLILLTFTASKVTAQNQTDFKPITEDGLERLLTNKIARVPLIRAVNSRGVAFQLTSFFEEELKEAGQYLGKTGLDALMTAIRANFRPPPVRPYRLTYRLLKGNAVDLLLEGKIGRWENELDGKYFIVQNEVFRTLSDLVTRFSDEFWGSNFKRIEGGPRRTTFQLANQYRTQHKHLFVGTSGTALWNLQEGTLVQVGTLFSSSGSAGLAPLIQSLSDPVRQWRFFAFKENPAFWSSEKPLNIVAFRKFSQPGDLDFYDDSPLQQFYSHITKDYMPPDFGIVQLTLEPPEDGCGHHVRTRPNLEWKASFIGPQLRMSVAIIENVSNDPISVGRVILKENRSAQLQSRDAVSAALQSLPAVKQELFGPRTLRAGESLVIPIELSLKTERKDLERYFASLYAAQISPSRYSELLTEADVATALTFPNNKGTDVAISAPALQRIINRQIVDFASMSEYVYGPSVSIESLEIDRFGYLVRRFEPGKLLITSDFNTEVGSCPFVYTYSARQESWLREGVILYGLDSKLRESTDEIPLQRFNGRVLIREEDPEDSFIDSISVRATGRDGNEILLLPENTKLLASDGDYVQLRQGEQMFLDFSLPPGFIGRKFSLVASGYYLPYKSRPAKFFKRQRPLRVQRVHSLQ